MKAASPERRLRFVIGSVAALLVLALTAVAWLQLRQQRLLDATVRYQDDYLQISLAQLQVEYLRLRAALVRAAQSDVPDRDAIQLRYDIFVSRYDLLNSGRAEQLIPDQTDLRTAVDRIGAFVREADQTLGPQPTRSLDADGARRLLDGMAPLDAVIQTLVLDASHAVAAQVAQRYDAVRDQGRFGALLTVLLAATSVGLALLAFALLRRELQRRRALQALTGELQQAHEAAEAASRAKSTFLANMSHELRTPFQGLLGSLNLLDRAPLDATQRRQLELARDTGHHLLSILNDVLDASRLEAGTLKLEVAPVSLRELVEDVRALMAGSARDKGLVLQASVDPDVPARARLDATRVRQVLFNLLSNAIKFTPAGRVELRLGLRGEMLVFAVEDTGVGMDAATMSRLFQRFSQGDASTSRRHGGAGLGLEISRQLARLMSGDIEVRSEVGRGSRFELAIPLQHGEDDAAPAPPPVQPAPTRLVLLVAEDNEVNREVLAAMIAQLGHEVQFAHDGHAAVQVARQRRFDLVLMDLHMPGLDGFDAARAIRALDGPVAAVPIVALTADAFAQTRERCLAVGMNDFLGKPVALDELARAIQRHAVRERLSA